MQFTDVVTPEENVFWEGAEFGQVKSNMAVGHPNGAVW